MEETKTVTVENDENKIELTIGSKTAVVNGKNISLDVSGCNSTKQNICACEICC